jgi:hypothetical protein
MMVKNVKKLPNDGQKCPKVSHDGQKFPKPNAFWSKMPKNYSIMVKTVKLPHDG